MIPAGIFLTASFIFCKFVQDKRTLMYKRTENIVELDDALSFTGPLSFNMMFKPAGSLCNLDCRYCYYLDKSEIYGGREPRMSLEMLEKAVKSYIEANENDEVMFNWHGGEPLIMGIDFYRKAVEFEKKYAAGKTVYNTVQTNGVLLDREWADFFRENGFLVGVSIDGPEEIHDRYRKDKGGGSVFGKVVRGIECLKDGGVPFNTMTTINRASEGKGKEIYRFLKSLGSRYMQFMPVMEHVKYSTDSKGRPIKGRMPWIVDPMEDGAMMAPWSVSSIGFGKVMCDIFDLWVRADVGSVFVGLFDATLANWCGIRPGTCIYDRTCGGNSVMEHNGDIYPCDHFVYPGYLLGNIMTGSLREIMRSGKQMKFGMDKRAALPYKCRKCKYLFACNGECPKHRFNRTDHAETGLNALCEGYYMFFEHVSPYMDKMAEFVSASKPAALVMQWARIMKA